MPAPCENDLPPARAPASESEARRTALHALIDELSAEDVRALWDDLPLLLQLLPD